MNKQMYLDMRGFDSSDWNVFNSDESAPFLEMDQAVNNMFPIKESKAITAFGKGAYIVKLAWMAKHTTTSIVEEPKSVPPPPPIPAPPTKMVAPTPAPQVPEESKELKSDFLLSRISNLEKAGWVDSGLCLDKDGVSLFYKDIEEMGNDMYMSLIAPKPIEETIDDSEVNTKDKRDLPWEDFKCEKYDNTGSACDSQCEACKEPEPRTAKQLERVKIMNDFGFIENVEKGEFLRGGVGVLTSFVINSEDEVFKLSVSSLIKTDNDLKGETKEAIKEIIEAVGVPADKVIIGSIKAPIEIKSVEKKTDDKNSVEAQVEKSKSLEKKEEPKKEEDKIPVPIASESTVKHFQVMDEVIDTLTVFKATFYAVESIKIIMESKDTPAKKVSAIKKVLNL